VLGVDLNADHLACCLLDPSGNPLGTPFSIPVETAGLPASRRDGRVRAAITALLDHAQQNCSAVVVENLDFADARATGRDTMGRGQRGKRFRRTVAGIPTGKFRSRLTSMAHRSGIAVIGADAAYTSKWVPSTGRNPCSSRLPIRSLGITPRRPRSVDVVSVWRSGDGRQDPATDRGPLRARHRPGPITHRATWVGTAVPAHRHAHDAGRSTGEPPPPAANTVRAAPEQDSLLLRHEERLPTMQTLRASVTWQ
jgi:IS605 OrfB family transposase